MEIKKAKFIITTISVMLLVLFLQLTNVTFANESSEIKFDKFNFPDANFRHALEMEFSKYLEDDLFTNDELQQIKSLDISAYNIKSLKGIEYFENLQYLNIELNLLQELDLSQNLNLRTLYASNNQLLTTLKLPNNIEIVELNFNTKLENFDIAQYKKLKWFYATDVKLNTVNVTELTNLVALNLENTGINEIDLSNNLNLEYINVSNNNLRKLDLRNNKQLTTIRAVNNKLETIYLPVSSRNDNTLEFYEQQTEEGFESVWYNGQNLINSNEKIKINGQTLISKVVGKTFSIVFNSNGGNGYQTSQNAIFGDYVKLNANKFYRIGYIFDGWSLKANSANPDFEDEEEVTIEKYPTNNKVVLYAVWKPIKYAIEFDANGGNGIMNSMQNLEYGTRYKLSSNAFYREGYIFKGWSKTKNSTSINYYDKSTISNLTSNDGTTIKLYAIWQKEEYNISLNIDGKISNKKVAYGEKLTKPASPTKTGYTFIGWFDTTTGKEYDFNKVVTKKISLIAKWKINSYRIVFNGNGNTKNNMPALVLQYGENFTLPSNTYIKNGYKFMGWSLSKNGNVQYTDKSSIKNLSTKNNDTVTLFAKWEKIKSNFNIQYGNVNSVYNGKSQTINIRNVPKGSVVEYRTSSSGKWSTTKPTRKEVGTTVVYFRVTNPDYNTFEGKANIRITAKSINTLNVSNISNKTYTGKQIKPSVTVKEGKTTLVNGKHYTLSYGTNKSTGKAYVKIKGKGNYTGTITKYFYIVPKTPSLSLSAGKGSISVTTKSTGASGYEVSYATSKNGKYKVVNSKSQKISLKRLTRGKKYYIKVRAYKLIDGRRVYSGYSSIKVIRTR